MPDKALDPVEWEIVRADIAMEKARLKANGDWAKWEEFQSQTNIRWARMRLLPIGWRERRGREASSSCCQAVASGAAGEGLGARWGGSRNASFNCMTALLWRRPTAAAAGSGQHRDGRQGAGAERKNAFAQSRGRRIGVHRHHGPITPYASPRVSQGAEPAAGANRTKSRPPSPMRSGAGPAVRRPPSAANAAVFASALRLPRRERASG